MKTASNAFCRTLLAKFQVSNFKFALLALALVLSPVFLAAQKFSVKGTLTDSLGAPLEAATVMLMNPTDSSLVSFGRTKSLGIFELRNIAAGRFLLRATYLGYHSFHKMVDVGGPVELGTIQMTPNTRLLGEATVSAEANPVTIKKDTIEFRAASFKTQPNATVEDLLKKLPGIEVERDGTIRAQGERVENVLVEGKQFFGKDPKMATQNLPADAVEKVQVYDKKSEAAAFTGVDDGQKEKTINLDLKEDRKEGWFGRLTAGAGDGDGIAPRAEGRLNLNKFTSKSQVSLLGMGNNINQPGFSFDDYMQFTGAMRRMMSGSGRVQLRFDTEDMPVPIDFGNNQGFLKTGAGGANFARDFGKKSSLNGSYFFANLGQDNAQSTTRQAFLPNGTFTTLGQSGQTSVNQSHRANFSIDQKIDSFNSVQFNANLLTSTTNSESASSSETSGPGQILQNASKRNGSAEGSNTGLQSDLLFRHKFHKKGRNVALTANLGLTNADNDQFNFSENSFFTESGGAPRIDTIRQNAVYKNEGRALGAGATFTEPLGKKRYLEFKYNFNRLDNQADRSVFDLPGGSERVFNSLLSNAFESHFSYHRGGLGYRMNRKTWNGSIGLDAQAARLRGEVTSGSGQPVSRNFRHWLPRAQFQKQFDNNKNLNFEYSSDINAPTVQQLQPVPDFSDPLNIREGNPALQPEFANNMSLHYSQFSPETFRSFFIMGALTLTQDRISEAQFIDSQFVRRYRPMNTGTAWQAFTNVSFGWPVKKWHSRFNLRTEGRLARDRNFLNERENLTNSSVVSQALDWEFTPREWFTLNTGLEIGWNKAAYSLDGQFDQNYFDQIYSSEATLNLPRNWTLNSSLNLTVNSGRAEGFNQSIPIWNAGIAKIAGKRKRLELGLVVRDLLNENVGIRRNASLNFVEDTRTASLGRYFMLRATYSLTNLGAGGQGPGMRVMIRR